MARERLEAARRELRAGSDSSAVSLAYYAMLYAARAALSEEERNAKTHAGTWGLFRETFVTPGLFDASLFSEAHGVQQLREAADYEALIVAREEAERVVDLAGRLVAAVTALIGA